jgi:MOSC domain-containing protein YiiM
MRFACGRILTSSRCTTTSRPSDFRVSQEGRIEPALFCLMNGSTDSFRAERGTVVQVNVSSGGLPKLPILFADLDEHGVSGDCHTNRKYHGGPKRAVLLIASEVIDNLRAEGWPLVYGSLGENLTTRGLDHRLWRPGQRFEAGSALLELTIPRQPCLNLNRYGLGIQKRIWQRRIKDLDYSSPLWGLSGFFASVVRAGNVKAADIIERVETTL